MIASESDGGIDVGEGRYKQAKQGCIPALWNAVGSELGAPGQGCLLMMIPLIIGALRLTIKAWKWEGPVEGVMVWWVAGVFLGGIGLGHEGLKLAPNLRHFGMPIRGIAIGLVLVAATIVMLVVPAIGHRAAIMAMLGLGALFGLFGASWLGL